MNYVCVGLSGGVFAYKAADMAKAKTPEDFAEALGIRVEDFERYGFDINDPFFEEMKKNK